MSGSAGLAMRSPEREVNRGVMYRRDMLSSLAATALIALTALPACSAEPGSSSPAVAAVSPVAAPPPEFRVRIPYSLQGVPGPWWRDNAMHADFDVDQRGCRKVSSQARKEAASDDRNDAAYRAFLDCMTRHAWTRGVPPPQTDPEAVDAAA
jgi:hypothetical protein